MTDRAAPTSLPVDLEELCLAMEAEADGEDLRWYLDAQTGDVILVNREYEPDENGGLTVRELETTPTRFVKVPPGSSAIEGDMRDFVKQVTDARLRESLDLALSAPRPERRFRAVLGWLPEEQERWRLFRLGRTDARAHSWLKSLDIVAVARPASAE